MLDRRILFAALTLAACGPATQELGSNDEALRHRDAGKAPAPDAGAFIDASMPAADASPGFDAGQGQKDGSAPGSCGGVICRNGQTCAAGTCIYDNCTGYKVPGDYPTIQAAFTALAPVGGTICLAPGTYVESPQLVNAQKPVSLIGVAADRTFIRGALNLYGTANVDLRGVSVDGGTGMALNCSITGAALSVENSSFISSIPIDPAAPMTYATLFFAAATQATTGTQTASFSGITVRNSGGGNAMMIYRQAAYGNWAVTIDGADLSTTKASGSALSLLDEQDSGVNPVAVRLQNSYLHDANYGVSVTLRHDNNVLVQYALTLLNNAILDTNKAIYVAGNVGFFQSPIAYHNNLLVNAGVAAEIDNNDPRVAPTVSSGHNLYFGNTNNLGGIAIHGAGDVAADPLLDTSVKPPALKAGSPARGAGDPAHAPDHDFWGRPRAGSIDLGPVQAP